MVRMKSTYGKTSRSVEISRLFLQTRELECPEWTLQFCIREACIDGIEPRIRLRLQLGNDQR